jgi:hypothetical protein
MPQATAAPVPLTLTERPAPAEEVGGVQLINAEDLLAENKCSCSGSDDQPY